MNYSKFQDINELKLALKNQLIDDVEVTFDKLGQVLTGKGYNELILFKTRYNKHEKDKIKELISNENDHLFYARLTNDITEFIHDLKENHFKPEILEQFGTIAKNDTGKDNLPTESLRTFPIRPLENVEPIVALLVFANDTDTPLKNLQEEEIEVKYALKHFEKSGGNIEVVSVSSVKEIFKYFELYKGQIGLVHYGGHASGKGLQIDGTLANAKGLANLMGTEPNLQFVFLNGCATKDQVKLLEQNNVKTVIATSAPINDRKATDFAIRFYQNLTFFGGENTLEDAFKNAKAYTETTSMQPVEIGMNRGFVFNDEKPISAFNWALYGNPENWKWKLPKIGVNIKKN